MRLYVDSQYVSPYAMSVFVALKEKGIPFDTSTIDLSSRANYEFEFASKSLTQRVPVISDAGFHLSESTAITEYLDDTYPGPALYPKDPKAKARARQIQAWLRSDLIPIRQERSTEVIFYRPKIEPLSSSAQNAVEKLFKASNDLLAQNADYIFGSWSIVDVDLALMLNRLIFNGDTVPKLFAEYARRQWERPSVKLWVNQVRPPL